MNGNARIDTAAARAADVFELGPSSMRAFDGEDLLIGRRKELQVR